MVLAENPVEKKGHLEEVCVDGKTRSSNNKIHIEYTAKPGNTGINILFGPVIQQSQTYLFLTTR
jgi:hypothetical protein